VFPPGSTDPFPVGSGIASSSHASAPGPSSATLRAARRQRLVISRDR
jgi:hypothetical protein